MITRRLLRDDVRITLLEQLLQGHIAPGSRINEVTVARQLGVSRTPLREALLHLEKDGFLRSDAARGFFVLPLTIEEIKETYPILWTLELLALQLIGQPGAEQMKDLNRLNKAMGQEKDIDRILELDTQWHATLLVKCPNRRLLQMITSLKKIVHRYELAYVRDAGLVAASVGHHQDIVRAFEAGDAFAAGQLLQKHWQHGMQSLLSWLHDKELAVVEST